LKIFSICRWCTLRCEHLRECSKKCEMALMGYSGAWGNLIHKKPEVENLVALSLLNTIIIVYSINSDTLR
jgi:hypothetical protein